MALVVRLDPVDGVSLRRQELLVQASMAPRCGETVQQPLDATQFLPSKGGPTTTGFFFETSVRTPVSVVLLGKRLLANLEEGRSSSSRDARPPWARREGLERDVEEEEATRPLPIFSAGSQFKSPSRAVRAASPHRQGCPRPPRLRIYRLDRLHRRRAGRGVGEHEFVDQVVLPSEPFTGCGGSKTRIKRGVCFPSPPTAGEGLDSSVRFAPDPVAIRSPQPKETTPRIAPIMRITATGYNRPLLMPLLQSGASATTKDRSSRSTTLS